MKVADAPKAKELIVGRWEGTDPKGKKCAVEFTPFGTVKTVMPDHGSGKYVVTGDDALDMEFSGSGTTETARCKIAVTKNELSIEDKEGKRYEALLVMPGKYRRVDAFSADVKSIKELILGKWKSGTKKDTYDFARNGTFTRTFNGVKSGLKGKYSFVDEGKIRLDYPSLPNNIYWVKVKGDTLGLRLEKALQDELYERVKE